MRFDRSWLENSSSSIIFEELWKHREIINARFYDLDDRYGHRGELNQYLCSADEFETDYNDEVFDGGHWCKVVHLLPSIVKDIIERSEKKKYTFRFHRHEWTDISVEATSEEEAIKMAMDKYSGGDYVDDYEAFEEQGMENITKEE